MPNLHKKKKKNQKIKKMKTNFEELIYQNSKSETKTYEIKICHRTQLIKSNEEIYITRFNLHEDNELIFEIINKYDPQVVHVRDTIDCNFLQIIDVQ